MLHKFLPRAIFPKPSTPHEGPFFWDKSLSISAGLSKEISKLTPLIFHDPVVSILGVCSIASDENSVRDLSAAVWVIVNSIIEVLQVWILETKHNSYWANVSNDLPETILVRNLKFPQEIFAYFIHVEFPRVGVAKYFFATAYLSSFEYSQLLL